MNHKLLFSLTFMLIFLVATMAFSQSNSYNLTDRCDSEHGYLGIGIKELSSTLKKQLDIKEGAVVISVQEDSPAEKAGLKEDDIILKVNDKKIRKPSTLSRIIKKFEPGNEVKITFLRDGKQNTVTAKIAEFENFSFNDFNIFCYNSHAYLGINIQDLNDDLGNEHIILNKYPSNIKMNVKKNFNKHKHFQKNNHIKIDKYIRSSENFI